MKRFKIMLTAIAVMAVVGGALAFKANTFNTKKVFLKDSAGRCKIEVTSHILTTTNPDEPKVWVSDVFDGTCISTYTTEVPN